MPSLLSSHLSQISLCAASISSLPFPGPKIFTNALLAPHDITALIRDTEAHERALFHLAPPPMPMGLDFNSSSTSTAAAAGAARRATGYAGAVKPPRRNTAVAAVLGGDLYQRTRRGEDKSRLEVGEVDVEILLKGAEKLCAIYPIPGAPERIVAQRRRYQELSASIAHYDERVAQQGLQLERMNRPTGSSYIEEDEGGDEAPAWTAEDLRAEEEAIRELLQKKSGLEERVSSMEKDLGGLMR